MARSATGKLREARELEVEARKLQKVDPTVADDLRGIAHRKRKSAVKQLKTRPRRKSATTIVRR